MHKKEMQQAIAEKLNGVVSNIRWIETEGNDSRFIEGLEDLSDAIALLADIRREVNRDLGLFQVVHKVNETAESEDAPQACDRYVRTGVFLDEESPDECLYCRMSEEDHK